MASNFLISFEQLIGHGPVKAARALGVAYPTYAAYRSASRVLPKYHVNHIHAIVLLSPDARKLYIDWNINGNG